MIRHSRFESGRDRAREGRDRRGDEHVLRHAARLHRRGLPGAPLRRTSRSDGRSSAARRRYGPRPAGPFRSTSSASTAGPLVVGVGGKFAEGPVELEELLAEVPRAIPAGPPRLALERLRPSAMVHSKESDQAHVSSGGPLPLTHPDRYALQLLGTVLGTGMSSRLFTEVRERRGLAYYVYGVNNKLHGRRLALLAGGRRHQQDRRGRRDDRARDQADRRGAGAGRRALRRRGTLPRAASCCSPRARTGRSCSGFVARCSRGTPTEPTEGLLEGLDAVTVQDLQRVAQDVIGRNAMNLAGRSGRSRTPSVSRRSSRAEYEVPRASTSSYGGAFVLAAALRPARRQSR